MARVVRRIRGSRARARSWPALVVVAVAGLAGASPASAHHSYPASYAGTVDGTSIAVSFSVSSGEVVTAFYYGPGEFCGVSGQGQVGGSDFIGDDHTMFLGDGQATYVTATFPDFRQAKGTLRLKTPFSSCIVNWSATTQAALPPECHDDEDNDLDGRKDFPADPDCTNKSDNDESDTTPPNTTISSGPAEGATVRGGASFGFYGTAGDTARFECMLDAGSWTACNPGVSYTGLSDGNHTFRVRAIDAAGNADPTPAVRNFKSDATPPDTAFTGGPEDGAVISDPSPVFTFEGTPASDVSKYYCYVNDVYKGQCTSGAAFPDAPLADGTYTLKVAAVDAVGNQDQSRATRTFRVDTTPPDTLVVAGPAEGETTYDRSPVFEFAANPDWDVDHFVCAVDGATPQPCESGKPLPGSPFADGEHRFTVAAVDAAGHVDPTPAERSFRVEEPPPTPTPTPTPPSDPGTPQDPGTPPPGGGQPPAQDPPSPPAVEAGSKKKQKALKKRGVIVKAMCPQEDCALTAAGVIKLQKGRIKLGKAQVAGTAGQPVKLKLKLSKSAARKLGKALRRKRSAKRAFALVLVRASNAAGESTPVELRIRLKR